MKKADFDKLKPPQRADRADRSKSKAGTRQRSASGTTQKEYSIGAGGKKIPIHCRTFLQSGTCEHEKINPGKKCKFGHYNKAEFDDKCTSLNPS